MAVKVGINGFGRIGRNVFAPRSAIPRSNSSQSMTSPVPPTLAHLLKYDSILGNLKNEIFAGEDFIAVDGKKIKVFAERDPAKLDWASVGAQIVVESTGFFTDADEGQGAPRRDRQEGHHLRAGHATRTSPSSSASTTTSTTPPSTTSSPTPPAPRTASRPSSRCCTTPSASSAAS